MDESYTQRFGGIGRLYGAAALPRLAKAHVAIVGVGGVGSWVVEALARSGIGELTLIDMDDVCITNTNRQLPALAHTVGHSKVAVLAARVAEINPACRVNRVIEFLTEANVDRLLAPDFDFVVDAVDRTSVKALIIAKCQARGQSVITSGSAGGRRDPTLIKVTDLGHAGTDPLLKGVRQCLRRDHGFPKSAEGRPLAMGVPCVFSAEKPVYPWADGSCSLQPEAGAETGLRLDCAAGFGAATFVTGAFGFALSAEVVRRIVN
jgi:tRNA A37 threonylcarbamoyladenosine dehydratase